MKSVLWSTLPGLAVPGPLHGDSHEGCRMRPAPLSASHVDGIRERFCGYNACLLTADLVFPGTVWRPSANSTTHTRYQVIPSRPWSVSHPPSPTDPLPPTPRGRWADLQEQACCHGLPAGDEIRLHEQDILAQLLWTRGAGGHPWRGQGLRLVCLWGRGWPCSGCVGSYVILPSGSVGNGGTFPSPSTAPDLSAPAKLKFKPQRPGQAGS